MRKIFLHLFVCWGVMAGLAAPARAETIIRDAEIETMLRDWTAPVMRAAGLEPAAVKIILVQSPEINAFVAGGQNIFVYTGLLQKTDNAGEVVGVLAHEMGHIAGGHLIRTQGEMEKASYEVMLGTLLGIGAAIASGDGHAAGAAIGAAGTFAQRNLLTHSRAQESAADQAAVRFLKTAQINPNGLVTFMEKLVDQELLPTTQQNEYVRTHPLSRDRVMVLEAALADSPLRLKPLPSIWADQHARMKAKLVAFINPAQVPWLYADTDHSIAADSARAIAAYRQNQVQDALTKIDALIAREGQNPYFYELKGQMLLEFGRAGTAVPAYERAVALAPAQPLLTQALAQALLAVPRGTPEQISRAVELLETARVREDRSPRLYRLLATAYGRQGRDADAQVSLAEEALLQGRSADAKRLARAALAQPAALSRVSTRRAQDVLAELNDGEDAPSPPPAEGK